jgi:hypothetical protein
VLCNARHPSRGYLWIDHPDSNSRGERVAAELSTASTKTVFGMGESISYAPDNVQYEIDLEDENASEFPADLDAFQRWVA